MPQTTTAATLKQWLEKGDVVLIDVREPAEYAAGRIDGSQPMPLGMMTAAQIPPLNGRKLVLQCRSGGRSGMACEKISVENPELAPINLEGGILAWVAAGYDVVTGG